MEYLSVVVFIAVQAADQIAAGTFALHETPLSTPRLGHVAISTPDGAILIAGGLTKPDGGEFEAVATGAVYTPSIGNASCGADASMTP